MGKKEEHGRLTHRAICGKKRYGGGNADVELNYDNEDGEDEQPQQSHTSGPLDEECGQRSAFPGLDSLDTGSGEVGAEPTNVMEYLRMVRKEASDRPVFVAGRDNFVEKQAAVKESTEENKEDGKQPYRVDLQTHRKFILEYKQRKSEDELVSAEVLEPFPSSRKEWRRLIVSTEPRAAHIASLSAPVVITLLGYIHGWISPSLPEHLDEWAIALLVRLPDTIIGTDVAVLRGLAKKCYGVRANNQVDERTGQALDRIIGIVADCYYQYDIMPCVRELHP